MSLKEKLIMFGALCIPAISKRSRAKQVNGEGFWLLGVPCRTCKQQWMELRPAQFSPSIEQIVEALQGRTHHLAISSLWVVVLEA